MKWLSDMLRVVYLGGNQNPHLLFHSYRVFIPQVNHKRSPELADLSPQTYRCITHSRFIHCMCTKISLEDVQYHIVYNTKRLETNFYLMPGVWLNELFNTVNYYTVIKTML